MSTADSYFVNEGKVLVTGGTGFLGAYIIKELLDKNHQVRAIKRNSPLPFFIPETVLNKVEWVTGDILDAVSLEEAMDGVDAVIHAAAKVSFIARERRQMYKTNIEGTANVVNASLEKKIKKLVHVSSVAALGRRQDGGTVDEGKPWEEVSLSTHYAITKYRAEMEVWRAIAEGLNAVIINPSTILGYGDWNTTSCALFKSVYNEFPWYTNGINGFVDVEDTAKAAVLLLQSEITRERFVLSSDNWSFHQLFNKIAEEFEKKHPSREATPFLGSLAWRWEKIKSVFTGTPALLTKENVKVAQSKTYFDGSKITRYLPGFTFTPLNQTIEQVCRAYLQHIQPI
ncbi:MAG TPA: NAD-dependent epimerase/dehydratase family protein [Puia sp.]|nr:NAD-dependent epimerase/dehydratase family protein [Puia sp.]